MLKYLMIRSMDRRCVLVFGCGVLQRSMLRCARRLGLSTVGIDPCADAVARDEVDFFEVVGGQDFDGTMAVAMKYNVSAIVAAATDKPLVMMARVAESLHLPFMSLETAQCSTDKFRMKRRFQENGVPCARGRLLACADDAEGLAFPLIVKPRDNSGSRGVKLCRSREELQACLDEAFRYSRFDTVLAEEFISGKEYSVEALHDASGGSEVIQFTEKFVTPFPYNVELGHRQPALLDEPHRQAVGELVERIGRCLGFVCCASHTELKINGDKITIIETSPRTGGDFISSDLVPLSTGISMEGQLLRMALGESTDTRSGRKERSSGISFFHFPEGRVRRISPRLEELSSMPGVCLMDWQLSDGDLVRPVTNSLERYGSYIVEAETRAELDARMDACEKLVCSCVEIESDKA